MRSVLCHVAWFGFCSIQHGQGKPKESTRYTAIATRVILPDLNYSDQIDLSRFTPVRPIVNF